MTEKAKQLGQEVITGVYSNIPDDMNCGLTKREYFAGLAMQGILSNDTLYKEFMKWEDEERLDTGEYPDVYECCAIAALYYADAILQDLARTK